jgi:GT2 family glycosyltransferase
MIDTSEEDLFNDEDIVVIIAVYNNIRLLINCIKSLRRSNGVKVKIVIVDDASIVNINDALMEDGLNIDDIFILINKYEKWWAESTQIGINFALKNGASKVLLMNPDVTVDKNCLFELNQCLVGHSLDGACSCIYDSKGNIWWAGSKLKVIDLIAFKIVYLKQLRRAYNKIKAKKFWRTDEFSGRAVLLTSKVLKSVSLNYKKYPQYFSDTDYSLTITKHGFMVSVVEAAKSTVEEENSGQINTRSENYLKHIIKRYFDWRHGGIIPNWHSFFVTHYSSGTAFFSTIVIILRMFISISYEWFFKRK